ncbi:MAG TPA: SGNH/GDSL hydrolase family protein [Terriglobia bacterium]|nr:SGNH/GDSL hydrolase family protein [Terriglobia bacterium]
MLLLFVALVLQAQPRVHVSFIGDSIVRQEKSTWPDFLKDAFGKTALVVNFGVPGQRASQAVQAYDSQAHQNRPKNGEAGWCFVHIGVNDLAAGVSPNIVYENVKTLWAKCREDGYKVVAVTILPRVQDSQSEARRLDLNRYIMSNPKLYDYLVRPDLKLKDAGDPSLFYDGTHPTEKGARQLADIIAAELKAKGVPLQR